MTPVASSTRRSLGTSTSRATIHGSCAATGCNYNWGASELVLRHAGSLTSLSLSQGTTGIPGAPAVNVRVRQLGRSVAARQLQLVLLSGLDLPSAAVSRDGSNSALGSACGLPYAPAGCHKSASTSADTGYSALSPWRGFSPLSAIFLRSTSCKVPSTCPSFSSCPGIGAGVVACLNARGAVHEPPASMTSAIKDVAVELSILEMEEGCSLYDRFSRDPSARSVRFGMPTWLVPSHCRGAPALARLKAMMTCPSTKGWVGLEEEEKKAVVREAELLLGADEDWPLAGEGSDVADAGGSGTGGPGDGCASLGVSAARAAAAATRRGEMSIIQRKVGLEQSAGWVGGVVLLRDVYVDRWGRVFNGTHFFHAGRCSDDSALQVRSQQEEMIMEWDENVI